MCTGVAMRAAWRSCCIAHSGLHSTPPPAALAAPFRTTSVDTAVDAICRRLRHLSDQSPSNTDLEELNSRIDNAALSFLPGHIAKLAHAFLKAGLSHSPSWDTLSHVTVMQMDEMEPEHLAALAVPFAKFANVQVNKLIIKESVAQLPVITFFRRLAARSDGAIARLATPDAVAYAWSFAKAGLSVRRPFSLLCEHHLHADADWTPLAASQVLWAQAELGLEVSSLVKHAIKVVHGAREEADMHILAPAVHSAAMLALVHGAPKRDVNAQLQEIAHAAARRVAFPSTGDAQASRASEVLAGRQHNSRQPRSPADQEVPGGDGVTRRRGVRDSGGDGRRQGHSKEGVLCLQLLHAHQMLEAAHAVGSKRTITGRPRVKMRTWLMGGSETDDEEADQEAISKRALLQDAEQLHRLRAQVAAERQQQDTNYKRSKMQDHLGRVLKAMGLRFFREVPLVHGLAVVDFLVDGHRLRKRNVRGLVLEVDGPSHFVLQLPGSSAEPFMLPEMYPVLDHDAALAYWDVDGAVKDSGSTKARNMMLRYSGYSVVSIPYWEWVACPFDMRHEYVYKFLRRHLVDARQPRPKKRSTESAVDAPRHDRTDSRRERKSRMND